MKHVSELRSITSVVKDFQFFACEKWELASDHQGSSNTANIGGITWIDDILAGNGMFAKLGESMFDEYWMNYNQIALFKDGKPVMKEGQPVNITTLRGYLEHKGMNMALFNPRKSKRKGNGNEKGSDRDISE